MPVPDASVDVVFAICVVHHVPPAHWGAFAAEMARVLRPGGVAAIFEHNPLNPVTRRVVSNCVSTTTRSCCAATLPPSCYATPA